MEEKSVKQRIDELHVKEEMLLGKRKTELILGEDGKAYVKRLDKDLGVPQWVSGYQGIGRTFKTLEDLCYYYGLRIFELEQDIEDFDSLEDYIEYETIAWFKGEKKCWTLKEICEEFDFDYDKIFEWWNNNPDLSRDYLLMEMLLERSVDCYYDESGDFVIE